MTLSIGFEDVAICNLIANPVLVTIAKVNYQL